MIDIFISYSKTRVTEAAELARELGDLGYDVWWDTSLLPTGSFGAEIDRQLDAAKAVIVIWSPESVRSKWVRSEAAHGDRQDKLVNTHTGELDPAKQIPKPFDQIHSVPVDDIRTIVRALDALGVPRSGGKVSSDQAASAPTTVADAEDRLFAEVERNGSVAAFEYYLAEVPEGRHALVARFRLRDLTAKTQPPEVKQHSSVLGNVRTSSTSEGRIKVDAKIIHGAAEGWFRPGNGKAEWFKDHEHGPEMVVVPPGVFTMGSSDNDSEKPPHKVTIKAPLAVSRFAITFEEWDAAVTAGGVKHNPETRWGRGRQPVINVSWEDARTYRAWLSKASGKPYRLLSEAEWEYCCRAGTTTPYAYGNSITKQQAQFSESSTVEVGKFPPNAWGLHDMHGNVWEWCEDNWHPDYQGAPNDGSVWPGGDTPLRVLRGGSWFLLPQILRSAFRDRYHPGSRNLNIGFRVARTL